MNKHVYTFMFDIFVLVAITYSAQLTNDNDNEVDLTLQQVHEARSISNRVALINKLMNSLNRRDILELDQQSEYNDISFSSEQKTFQKDMLESHNRYRAHHCVPSLQLDDQLSRSAQNHAETLARENKLGHSHTRAVGENLWMGWSPTSIRNVNAHSATDAWYNEIKQYDFNNPGFSQETGHFTQVVWKNTKKMGVGFAISRDNHKAYVVAQYTPPGNYEGEFPRNVLPPNC